MDRFSTIDDADNYNLIRLNSPEESNVKMISSIVLYLFKRILYLPRELICVTICDLIILLVFLFEY